MKYVSSLFSSSLGNILEWYDFGLFSIYSSLFSQLFFPSKARSIALMTTLSLFAIGFLCRPLGALIFGYLGDKRGRASTLRLSLLMISLPTLFVGILPTYDQIGIFAPIGLLLIRIWQGISIGGEYSGNLIYLAETAPTRHRALFTSFTSIGSNLGILLAALVGITSSAFLSSDALHHGGWRIPYLLSGLLCLMLYRFRLKIKETPAFTQLAQSKQLARNPINTVFTNHLPALWRSVGLVCMGSTFYYFCFIFMPLYLSEQSNFSTAAISLLMTGLILIMIISTPLAGYLCDHIGRRKMLLYNAGIVALILIPGFYFIRMNVTWLTLVVLITFALLTASEQGTTSVALVENFPMPARYTGISLGFNLGNGLLGGTAPIVSAWLTAKLHQPLLPAAYIAGFAAITWLVVYFSIPETKGISLTHLNAANDPIKPSTHKTLMPDLSASSAGT